MSRRDTPTIRPLKPAKAVATGRTGAAPRIASGPPARPARAAWAPRRALAAVGAAGPIVFAAVSALAGLVKPGYDIAEQTVSDLAVGAHGWIQTTNFLLLGAAMIALALARGHRSASVAALLAAAGVGVVAAGFFETDLAGAPATSHGAIHNSLFLAVFLALIAAFALHGRALRRRGSERGLARYSTLTAVGVFALLVVFVMFAGDLGDPLHDVAGLLERLLIGLALAWITVISRRLLSEPGRAA
jgi:hypothetical membrane protein